MFQNFWNQLVEVNATANIIDVCAAIIAAAVLGGLIFLTYKMTSDEFAFDKNIGLVLFLVPVVVALLLSVIGTNVARAFSIAGVLAIVRYRSAVIKPRDLVYIFFGMGAGFAVGVRLYIPALIFVILTCIIVVVYTACTSGERKNIKKSLKIAVPENINYDGLFDEVLAKYTSASRMTGVRIISGGTVTELTYAVKIKNVKDTKAFLDELRTLNANFKIQLQEFVIDDRD